MPSENQRWKIPRPERDLTSWRQPKDLRDRVWLMPGGHITMYAQDWFALPRYDRSSPTGVWPGKAWASMHPDNSRTMIPYFNWCGRWRDLPLDEQG